MTNNDDTTTRTKGETNNVLETAKGSTTTNYGYDSGTRTGRNEDDDETGGVILIRPDGP